MKTVSESIDIPVKASDKDYMVTVVTTTTTDVQWSIKEVPRQEEPPTNEAIEFALQTLPGEVVNMSRGLQDFGGQAFAYPASVMYERLFWTQIEKQKGVYDWTYFDSLVKKAISKGQKLSFGVQMLSNSSGAFGVLNIAGGQLGYPQWVHDAMQKESVKDWNDGKAWYPNWNSETLLAAWETMLKALGVHIAANKWQGVIGLIDSRGYGNWGELHMDSINEPAANKATPKTLIRFIDSHLNAFDIYWVIYNINGIDQRYFGSEDVAYYAMTAKNKRGVMGFRTDHMGWYKTTAYDAQKQNRVYKGLNYYNQLRERYKYAPMVGEPMNDAPGSTPPMGTPYQTLIDEVKDYKMLVFSNETKDTGTASKNNYLNAAAATGFKWAILDGEIKDDTLTLHWLNSGLTPTYDDWDIVFEIRKDGKILWSGKSGVSLSMILPAEMTSIDKIAHISGDLYVSVKDRNGYSKNLALANPGRDSGGAYFLTSIIV